MSSIESYLSNKPKQCILIVLKLFFSLFTYFTFFFFFSGENKARAKQAKKAAAKAARESAKQARGGIPDPLDLDSDAASDNSSDSDLDWRYGWEDDLPDETILQEKRTDRLTNNEPKVSRKKNEK